MTRSGCHDDHGGSAGEAVSIPFDIDVADSRMANGLASFNVVPDIVSSPEGAELGAANGERTDDCDGTGMLGVPRDSGSEHPDVLDRHGATVGETQLSLVVKKREQHVSFRRGQIFRVAEELGGKRIPGKDVQVFTDDERGQLCCVEEGAGVPRHAGGVASGRRRRVS